jgi:L-lactate dehydrogenase complex protein LldF
MLREEVTRQSLACIRCGACLNACPVYRQVGGHAYGSVYPGPIGAVITPQLAGLERAAELPFASSLCGACRDVCPVKIDIPRLLLHLRSKIVSSPAPALIRNALNRNRRGGSRRLERWVFRLWAFALRRAWRYRLVSGLAARCLPAFLGRGRLARGLRKFCPPLRAWTAERELPAPARRSFRSTWPQLQRRASARYPGGES